MHKQFKMRAIQSGLLLVTLGVMFGCGEGIENTGIPGGFSFQDGLFFGIKTGVVIRDGSLALFDLSLDDGLSAHYRLFSPNLPPSSETQPNPSMVSAATGFLWEVCQQANVDNKAFYATIGNTFNEAGVRAIANHMAAYAGYVQFPEELFAILLEGTQAIYQKGRDEGDSESDAANDAYNAACTAMFTAMNALQG